MELMSIELNMDEMETWRIRAADPGERPHGKDAELWNA